MNVLTNAANWDPVLWVSLLMVLIAIGIITFLAFKVRSLMKQDAEAHKER